MRCQFCSNEYDDNLNRCPNCGMRPDYADAPSVAKSDEQGRKKIRRGPFGWYWHALKFWGRGKGRACRREYVFFTILTFMSWFALFLGAAWFLQAKMNLYFRDLGIWGYVVPGAAALFFVPGIISTTVRRLHDIGLSGWYFVVFAAVQHTLTICDLQKFTGILPFCLIAWPGARGENEYGPNPRYASEDDAAEAK